MPFQPGSLPFLLPDGCGVTVQKRTSIVLFESSAEQAVIQMKDGDRFFVAVADAARACQVFDKARDFANQFQELANITLPGWIEQHKDRIESAHITIRERDVLFLVVQKQVEFDRALSDALTELDLVVANSPNLNLIDLEVLAVPAVSRESCKAFLASGPIYDHAQ